jgi:catechol 2,3-dioxygenase-like lactoylglutathione lyase family enzyme
VQRARTDHGDDVDRAEEWADLKERYLRPPVERPPSTARGLHHFAVLCSDVERTIKFYQEVLEFPLVELFENRDYQGSTHFFFDVGHGNYLAYFDFPGLDLGPYAEVLGGLHHIAISVTTERWDYLVAKLDAAGVATHVVDGTSVYFAGPDGERLELLSFPLNDMYGVVVSAPEDV